MANVAPTVYGLYDQATGELRYIGKTVAGLSNRLSRHIAACGHRHTHVAHWIAGLTARPIIIALETTDDADLSAAEQRWIAEMRALGARLTNLTDGGEGTAGRRHSEDARRRMSEAAKARSQETRQRMSDAQRGKTASAEARRKMSAARIGRKRPADVCRKMSEAMRGRKKSPEHCRAIAAALTGRTLSAEHRARVGAAFRGRVCPEDVRLKMSAAAMGHPVSAESRHKMSISQRERFEREDRRRTEAGRWAS